MPKQWHHVPDTLAPAAALQSLTANHIAEQLEHIGMYGYAQSQGSADGDPDGTWHLLTQVSAYGVDGSDGWRQFMQELGIAAEYAE